MWFFYSAIMSGLGPEPVIGDVGSNVRFAR
jgi:hypothetical protein